MNLKKSHEFLEHSHNVATIKIESLEVDNALLTAKVEELQSLCMEFASMGRTTVNQNESLKHLCESYLEIANQRHLTTSRGKE